MIITRQFIKDISILVLAIFGFVPSNAQNTYPWAQTGNVGIGVISAAARLEVNAIGITPLRVVGSNGAILIDNVSSGQSYYQANTAHRFQGTSGNEVFTILGSGNVGVGVISPVAKLEVNATGITPLKVVGTNGYILIDNSASGQSYYQANAAHRFQGTSDIEVFTILGTGNVGVGVVSPDAKLAVNGTVHAKEVKVDLTNWPDYVFMPSYDLLPLQEVKSYIKRNQHLPDMPSAADISKNGLNLGETNKLLMKKIEELTLYLLQLKEENEKLNIENQIKFKALEERMIVLSEKSK